MTAFKFAHAADIHLGAPFSGLAARDSKAAGRLRNSVFDSWSRVVEVCIKEQVSFLVVAGDVFDQDILGPGTILRFRDTLRTLEQHNIQVFICHGNHDPLSAGAGIFDWPDNVTVFPVGEVQRCKVENGAGQVLAEIYGTSYGRAAETTDLLSLFTAHDSDTLAIGVLHCSMGAYTGRHQPYSPTTPDELDSKGYQYWALGHVHTRQRVELKSGALAVYTGNVQGLSARETGPRGFEIVTVDDDGSLNSTFVETCAVRWSKVRVSVEGIGSVAALYDRCSENISNIASELGAGQGAVVRVILEGRGEVHSQLNSISSLQSFGEHLAQTLSAMEEIVALEKVVDQTLPAADHENVLTSSPFAAEMMKQLEMMARDDNSYKVISELFDNSAARHWLSPPDSEKLKSILDSSGCSGDRYFRRVTGENSCVSRNS